MNLYCSEDCKNAFFELTIKKIVEKRDKKIAEQNKINEDFRLSISTKKKVRQLKKELKYNYTKHLANVKRNLQKWAKIRDEQKGICTCVSCGSFFKQEKEDRQGGHFFKAQNYTNISIHPNNIHSQCQHCNSFADGNGAGYSVGIRDRISEKQLEYLEKTANRGAYNYNKEFLNSFTDEILSQINSGIINENKLLFMIEDYLLKYNSQGISF
jgi:5-methylcytosine-specific restriction endonuclease McrA